MLRHDAGAINDALPDGLLSAGFYYKTFMAPAGAWAGLYEPLIRRAAAEAANPSSLILTSKAQRISLMSMAETWEP